MVRQTRLELEMGGKVRPLLFDFAFLDLLTDAVPLSDLDTLFAQKPWQAMAHVLTAALKSAADFENSKETFELKTVGRWYTGMAVADANRAFECYKDAMGFIRQSLLGADPVAENAP